jgi:hypothetical protein
MRSESEPARDKPDPFAEWNSGGSVSSVEPAAAPPASWSGEHRRASGARSPRLLAVALVGALAAGALVFAFTRGGGAAPLVSTPVSEAAYVTTRASGFKTAMTIGYTIAGQTLTLSANGSFNTAPSVDGSLNVVVPGGNSLSEIIIGSEVYIQPPPGDGQFAAPTPWVKADMSAYAGASTGSSSSVGPGGDPTQDLNFLRATGQVTTVGSESVRGVPTTHYHAVIDLNSYVAATPPSERAAASREVAEIEHVTGQDTLPADVWVDLRGRVRRMALDMNICSHAGTITTAVTIDLFDYGRQPAAVPPPASQVTDVSSQLATGTATATQQLGC